MPTWSVGVFTIKPGHEEDFLRILRDANVGSAEGALEAPKVLRDRDNPNVFITLTPWESVEAVDRFRVETMFPLMQEHADLFEDIVPRTLDEVDPHG